jgi:hypothetical protein
MAIIRRRFYLPGEGNCHPLDDYLWMPRHNLSYKLQSWIGKQSAEEDYRESVSLLNELLGLNLKASDVKRAIERLAPQVEPYYEQAPALNEEQAKEEGACLAIGNDGKGVPIIKSERGGQADTEARLMKGQKRGVKKEATVSVSFSFDPQRRSSEDILRGLFREKAEGGQEPKEAERISINVHKRAFMCDQKGAIDYAVKHSAKRDPAKNKPIVALVDCGPGLEEGILHAVKEQGLEDNLDAIIADIVHVSEYIWDAANAILGEKYKGRTEWVRSVMKDILESKVAQVIEDLQANRDKTNLSTSKKDKLDTVIRYLTNHQHKMDYKSYLEKGYPVSTGLIEGCCGHLVKDRMEGSGKRWTLDGAQQMLDLRAVKKNEDWKGFMGYVQQTKRQGLLEIRA